MNDVIKTTVVPTYIVNMATMIFHQLLSHEMGTSKRDFSSSFSALRKEVRY